MPHTGKSAHVGRTEGVGVRGQGLEDVRRLGVAHGLGALQLTCCAVFAHRLDLRLLHVGEQIRARLPRGGGETGRGWHGDRTRKPRGTGERGTMDVRRDSASMMPRHWPRPDVYRLPLPRHRRGPA